MLGVDLELGRAALGLEFDLRHAGRAFQDTLDLLGELLEHVVVVAKDFYGQFRLGALQHFIETHFDGLGEEQAVVGIDLLEHSLDLFAQLRLARGTSGGLRPFAERLVEDIHVALVRRHRVGGDGAGADAGEDPREFGELLEELVLHLDVRAERFLHAHADGFVEHRGDRALVQFGRELRAQVREKPERRRKQRGRRAHHHPAKPQRRSQGRRIDPLGEADEQIVALRDLAAQKERAQGGHQREGKHQRAAEGEHHGERHRVEHFPLDAGEGEDRHVDHGNDDDTKEHRVAHLLAGGEDGVVAFFGGQGAAELVLPEAELPDDVLHDDHRAVDDQAEVDGP